MVRKVWLFTMVLGHSRWLWGRFLAGRLRCTLAELVEALGRAERDGRLPEKIRFLAGTSLLIVDEIGYLPISPGGANLFFQLVNARYETVQ